MIAFKKVLVPTDFSHAAVEAFQTAVALAKASGGEVVLAHVTRGTTIAVENGRITSDAAPVKSQNLWERFKVHESNEPSVAITHEIVSAGRVSAGGIVKMLEKFSCDLIVIGSHNHGGLRRLFRGSLTDEVIRNAHCPVLVVKAPVTRPTAPTKPVPAQAGRIA